MQFVPRTHLGSLRSSRRIKSTAKEGKRTNRGHCEFGPQTPSGPFGFSEPALADIAPQSKQTSGLRRLVAPNAAELVCLSASSGHGWIVARGDCNTDFYRSWCSRKLRGYEPLPLRSQPSHKVNDSDHLHPRRRKAPSDPDRRSRGQTCRSSKQASRVGELRRGQWIDPFAGRRR